LSIDLGYKGDDPWSYYFAFFGGVGAPGMTKKHQEKEDHQFLYQHAVDILRPIIQQRLKILDHFLDAVTQRSSGPSTGLGTLW